MSFLLKKIGMGAVTLVLVLLFTFFLLHTVPGGPFDSERVLPPEIEANLYQKYGLQKQGDQPFVTWFLKDTRAYVRYLARGELGPSLKYRDRDVAEVLGEAFPPSLILGSLAFGLSLILGIAFGVLAVAFDQRATGRVITTLARIFLSLPRFVVALLLVSLFSLAFKLFPPALWEGPHSLVLPVLTLALVPLALITDTVRGSLMREMHADYLRTARAKGLTHLASLLRHGLKNAAFPILTLAGPIATDLIAGSFIVETIFGIPGLGKNFVTAVTDRDTFLVMGITLFYGMLVIGFNLAVDFIYAALDPRVKQGGKPA